MTTPDLNAIRKRCEAATKGPWMYDAESGYLDSVDLRACYERDKMPGIDAASRPFCVMLDSTGDLRPCDSTFIAHARTDIPALLDYVDALLAGGREAVALLKEIVDNYFIDATSNSDLGTRIAAFLKRADEGGA